MIYWFLSFILSCIGNYLQQAFNHFLQTRVKFKTRFQICAGKILTYFAVFMSRYLNIWAEDGFSMFKNQYIMLGRTELSGTTSKFEKKFEVRMFLKCVSDGGNAPFIRNIFSSMWMLSFGEYHNYRTFKNILMSTEIIKQLGYTSLSAMYSASIVFLLVDDSGEAYAFSKEIEDNKIPPSMSAVFYILQQNGTYRMIKNWDIKMLAAMHVITSMLTNKTLERTKKDTTFQNIAQKSKDEDLDINILEEFARMWISLDGKTNLFLSSLRLQFFIHFCSVAKYLDMDQQKQYKEKIVSKFYQGTENSLFLSGLPFLTIALKLFSDGLLQNEEQLQKFQDVDYHPVTSNSKLILNLEKINLNDVKMIKYSKISPHFNFLGGRRVRHGMCLIINQTFKQHPLLYRAGTEKDEQDLKTVWDHLGCRNFVKIKRDLSKFEMMEALKSFRDNLREHNPDYFVICILGHGNLNKKKRRDEVMDANLEMVSMNKIKNMFVDGRQCPSMIGKPKLFFVQACRGKENQNMIDTDMSETDGEDGIEETVQNGKKYINKSWFFVFQSTIKGFASNRHPQNGTIFIQSLCKEMMENGRKLNLATIASSVNQRIMRKFNIQAPIYENQLGDFIYFEPDDAQRGVLDENLIGL